MNVTTGLKRTVGGVVAAAAVLAIALMPSGSAMASPTGINVDTAATATMTINGTRQAMVGHTFKAVKLASYTDAQAEGTELASVSVTSNSALATGLDTAYTAANNNTPVDAGHVGNIMSAVTEKWLGFTSTASSTNEDTTSNNSSLAWTGKLRDFVTKLVIQPDFTTVLSTAPSASGPAVGSPGDPTDDATAVFGSLTTGLYLIVDTTGSPTQITGNASPAAIPMLAGTVLKSTAPQQTYDHFANDQLMVLGSVTMKSNIPTLKKKISNPSYGSASIGSLVTYQLLGSIPLTTGFTHYTYKLTDTPAAGLTYQATPNPLKVDVVSSEFGASVQSLTLGVDYTFTPPTNPGDPIIVNLSPGIVNLGKTQYGKFIRVEYVMKINDNATNSTVSNGVTLAYSNDPSHQPSNDDGDDTGGNGSVSTIDDTDPGTEANIYFYSFTMDVQAKINAATKLSGASFKIYDSANPTTPLRFKKLADGSYKKVASTTALDPGNIVEEIVSATGGQGGLTKGQLKVDGLGSDTYTVEETVVPSGYSGAFASTFTVTMNTNTPNSAAQPAYSNSNDGWLLVQAASWPYTAGASHLIAVQEVTSFSQLPMTGGAGAIVVGLAVVVLLGGAGALFVYIRRKEKSLSQEV
ncbi:isopeptide-forming domain-containing fimbrial protein [Bifidobacterium sp. ESL0769]|uniref:isopeptide-forming domain-containing fimbrial protein n=1 Tax=Bifidobacterium sp. ESL0769 TaxID=2983229 RepID=UPI0023F942A4|nr:isopeptide-forming domain-containing fimbrial protein [Bifidobacterium sp. ESL0769]WEV66881.1 isopeptide-forming domain-containing fimbrial protein [Bifidobacterium sp. ESL0769]